MIHKYVKKEYIKPLQIPTINANELTDEKFLKLSNNYRNSVLIKGYMKNSDAVDKWNIDYLKNIIGDFKLNTVKYDNKLIIENISFNEFTNKLNENIYINNNHTILAEYPELFDDVKEEFDSLLNTLKSSNLSHIHIANLFIGLNNDKKLCTGSNMHCGGSGNFFCMLHGKKYWTLIDPKYSCLLKGRVAESGIHGQTLFDMSDTRLDTFPEMFEYLPRYEVLMEEGDVLWNAPWWWHRIRNYDGLSIGMAIRNNKVTKLNLQNNLMYTLSGSIYLKYNTLLIGLYEKYFCKKKFATSKEETGKNNVLYQIEGLRKRYPKSIKIEDI